MAFGTHHSRLKRPAALAGGPVPAVQIDVLENPILKEDPGLGSQVEEELRQALEGEDLGSVQVRFRICRDDADAVKFICKVENTPRREADPGPPQWRWWSPLLETAQEFRQSLDQGLRIRRARLLTAGLLSR